MFSTSLLSSVFLALAASANPVVTIRSAPITLQISRSLNKTNIVNLYQNDFNRAQALKAQGTDNVANKFISTPALNDDIHSIARVAIGSPPTPYDLVVDTGSAVTWVGAKKRYVQTRSSTQTGSKVTVNYNSGMMSGTLYTDTVTLGPRFASQKQLIGVASIMKGFQDKDIDGLLGLGPVVLTVGSRIDDPRATIPTVTDNLFAARKIPANMVALSFQPPVAGTSSVTGQLTWGATDRSKYKGSITYVPLTTSAPTSKYWGIKQTVTYGSWFGKSILSNAVGVIDSGASLLLIASDAFLRYQAATGATLDPVTKLLTITPAGFAKMKSLYFKIGPVKFEFTANAQIWPRTLNSVINGAPGKIYLVIGDIGRKSGSGWDFTNGHCWLERFYTVYDTTNKRVGIANTPFTYAKTN